MIIQGYSIDFFRNVKDYKSPKFMTFAEKNELKNKIISSISKEKLDLKYLPNCLFDSKEIENLADNNLLSFDFPQNADVAVLFEPAGDKIIKINDLEHITISGYTNDNPIKKYEEIYNLAANLEKDLNFQHDRQFGYLTNELPLCGNGFIVDTLVHVPALLYSGKLMYTINKLLRRPGTLMIPYSERDTKSSFFIIRCISKTEPYRDIKTIQNLAEEISVREETEVKDLMENEDLMNLLSTRVEALKKEEAINNTNFMKALDDYVFYRKLKGEMVTPKQIEKILTDAKKHERILEKTMDNVNMSEVSKKYHDILFSSKEEANA